MGLVSDRLLAAAFFIPKENQQQNQSIEVLLRKAGAIKINRPAPERVMDCKWAGMACQAYTHDELTSYQLLVIEFMQDIFLKGIPLEDSDLLPEEDENLHVALTFKDACEALKPEVAYIATHLDTAEFDAIVKVADKIEGYDADYIAGEAGLVYLRGIIADCLTDPPLEYAPDTMPVSEGVLVFGGRGSKRWW